MKPFNLERALAGDPVVTRDGRPVKVAGYNPDAKLSQKVIGWVKSENLNWMEDGRFISDQASSADLFMAPTELKEWIVRLNPNNNAYYKGPFHTEVAAVAYANNWEGATIHEITLHE
jgi:ribosomal protein S16